MLRFKITSTPRDALFPPPAHLVLVSSMKPRLVSVLCILAAAQTFAAYIAADEQRLWERERAYWQYVETNNLASYANLCSLCRLLDNLQLAG